MHRSLALTLQTLMSVSGDDTLAGVIARHAERGGERGLAYQAALTASRTAAERFTREEALSWLDRAAACARTAAEAAEVNRLTALLVDDSPPILQPR